jgi:hypothetical protein
MAALPIRTKIGSTVHLPQQLMAGNGSEKVRRPWFLTRSLVPNRGRTSRHRFKSALLIARPINQNPTLPVKYGIGGLNLGYSTPAQGGSRIVADAVDTKINATIVSGLTPSRPNQSYGGLHNFPRFLELWGDRNSRGKQRFFFAGSFLQLNFSNYATGPFEQEGWEPNQIASTAEPIPHYQPPNRLWGYDVGLQFSPAGPIAARFVTPSSTRSEFYTEPPVSDPYINKLCNAANAVADITNKRPPGKPFNCVAQNP